MRAALLTSLLFSGLMVVPVAWSQTSTTTNSTTTNTTTDTDKADPATGTPSENVGGGRISARAPGTWVRNALNRHSELHADRLGSARNGEASQESQQRFGTGSGTGTTTSGSGLDLLSLASNFLSGGGLQSLTGTGGLGSLLGSLTGTGSTQTGTAQSGSTIDPTTGLDTSGMTPAELAAFQELLRLQQSQGSSQSTLKAINTTGTVETKVADRAQTTQQQTETPFRIRWSNAMLQTLFTSLAVGLQSNAFIEVLKDALRPIMLPPANTENTNGTDNGGTGGNGNNGGSNGGGNGGGIEDLPPTNPGNNDGGSTL